ncbi:hypothetical protein GE09DRAFT_466955 [Coniochaeta sp. 2T2.1]|nr:hypothetical protein GE09DRAFT_466955 [Coniochaeta sp. 2T2.1]
MTNTSRRPRLRPQVYVHVEFGVSLTGDQPPRNHEVTYRSRAMRERQPPFPRQVPAPNTNYLFNAPPPQQHLQLVRPQQHPPVPYDWEMFHGYYAPPLPPPGIRHEGDTDERRSSRSDSRSSHERGRSAPPPVGSNPWDVSVSQAQQQAAAAYQQGSSSNGQSSRQPPEVWKALPEVPTRYRLGEDSLPWGAWSVPYGYDPEAHPQDDEHPPRPATATASTSGSNVASATSPTEVSVFSPGPSGPGFRPDADPGRVQELGALGAALMTVDNGFENQWWHQGQREVVATGDVVGETIQSPQRFSRNSLGWAVASTSSRGGAAFDRTLSFASTDVVSPLPAYVSPDSAVVREGLTRSLSTRSDELFFRERGSGALPA